MSPATPFSSVVSRSPTPGSDDSAPGLPFGGLAIGWAGPLSAISVRPVPVSPGYVGSEYPFVTSPRSSALKPATLDQVKLFPGASPAPLT